MGEQEEKSKKKTRYNNVQAAVLATVAVSGLLAVAVIAPNVIQAMHRFGMFPNNRQAESIQRAFARLRKKGLIAVRDGRYVLTENGEYALSAQGNARLLNPTPRRWDTKWRVLVFDLPKSHAHARQRLYGMLRANGFFLLQKSVWVYPYPCDDFVAMLKTVLRIRPFVLYMIVDSIENQEYLEKHFRLW